MGDERQLPPMLDENISREARGDDSDDGEPLETSLFQTLIEQSDEAGGEYAAMLRTQYRMAPEIGNLVSSVFYEGKLENGARPPRDGFGWMPKPVTWFTTSHRSDRRESRRWQSFANAAEAEVVVALLEKLAAKPPPGSDPISVGVITGYSAQVDELTRRVNPRNRSKWRRLDIDVATVDSFQGRECDVVIYSTVRSNDRWTIGFLKDYRPRQRSPVARPRPAADSRRPRDDAKRRHRRHRPRAKPVRVRAEIHQRNPSASAPWKTAKP